MDPQENRNLKPLTTLRRGQPDRAATGRQPAVTLWFQLPTVTVRKMREAIGIALRDAMNSLPCEPQPVSVAQ